MKYRYLKIIGDVIWGTNNLTKEDLVRLKDGLYQCVIDLQEMKNFNAKFNQWEDVKGD
jgi:hypothetical protein